ncbi:MAG: hypothetical protein JNL23_02825 [Chitinophagaceae bacterium]|nr:hypothetical protein [Chitinophagaceae bacterium]
MNNYFYIGILILATGCKAGDNSDKKFEAVEGENAYRLVLNPTAGSEYHYDITNQSEMNVEANDKQVENSSKSDIGLTYQVDRDSAGLFLLKMRYDKILLHTKTDKAETEMDAANAAVSINPAEKMLGILKDAELTAVLTRTGEVKSISGYKEMGEKMLAEFGESGHDKNMIQGQWEKSIGEGIIRKGMTELFNIFPDTLVRVGDKWKLSSRQEGEVTMNVKATYQLQEIEDGIALIKSEGEIISDKTARPNTINGAIADLNGTQKGEYRIEVKTGMMINSNITSVVKGTVQAMGHEVPVEIKTKIKMIGKRVR